MASSRACSRSVVTWTFGDVLAVAPDVGAGALPINLQPPHRTASATKTPRSNAPARITER